MKLLVVVMLISITTATGVFAEAIEPFSGLGRDRSTLSLEQIEARTARLEASTTFSLLRHPGARQGLPASRSSPRDPRKSSAWRSTGRSRSDRVP
ncbi:MAG: hypothetical protein EXQ55_08980 [Acidobacteria bacterium]|nr:hypothetical protein [Acidobacteriota bacterium]